MIYNINGILHEVAEVVAYQTNCITCEPIGITKPAAVCTIIAALMLFSLNIFWGSQT
jgi:hypothetical protein